MSEKTQSDKASKPKSVFKRIKSVKNIEIIIAVLAVAVMLVIYFSSKIDFNASAAGTQNGNETIETRQDYCQRMEKQLAEALGAMKGAGEVKVVINWESGVESVLAYITSESGSSSSSAPQIISGTGGGTPIVLKEIYPKALGVIILSQGGDNIAVKIDIINAVSVLLNITPDKISVFTMKQ